jgi:hypothetical protein
MFLRLCFPWKVFGAMKAALEGNRAFLESPPLITSVGCNVLAVQVTVLEDANPLGCVAFELDA